jgi:hypothetical protein
MRQPSFQAFQPAPMTIFGRHLLHMLDAPLPDEVSRKEPGELPDAIGFASR